MEIKVTNFILADHFASPNTPHRLEFIFPSLQEFKKLKVPTNTAYNIIKSIGVVEKVLKEYNDTRVMICESLCEKDEKGNPKVENNKYVFTKENQNEFNNKWTDLLNTEINLDIWQINQSDLSHIKEMNITCYETLLKYGFIKEDTK